MHTWACWDRKESFGGVQLVGYSVGGAHEERVAGGGEQLDGRVLSARALSYGVAEGQVVLAADLTSMVDRFLLSLQPQRNSWMTSQRR